MAFELMWLDSFVGDELTWQTSFGEVNAFSVGNAVGTISGVISGTLSSSSGAQFNVDDAASGSVAGVISGTMSIGFTLYEGPTPLQVAARYYLQQING